MDPTVYRSKYRHNVDNNRCRFDSKKTECVYIYIYDMNPYIYVLFTSEISTPYRDQFKKMAWQAPSSEKY